MRDKGDHMTNHSDSRDVEASLTSQGKSAPAPRIFISYASEDRGTAREVCRRFRGAGLQTWLDVEELKPGQNWDREIVKALGLCDVFIALMSKRSVSKRGYLRREAKSALTPLTLVPRSNALIVPVRIEECKIPRTFRHLHWIDYFAKDGSQGLIDIVVDHLSETTDHMRYIAGSRKLGTDSPPFAEETPTQKESMEHSRRFRSVPLVLSRKEIIERARELGFAVPGVGIMGERRARLELRRIGREHVVVDTEAGLMWPPDGSKVMMTWASYPGKYIRQLNESAFAGYDDWRMPTVEELGSLLTSRKNPEQLYIDSNFNSRCETFWTADKVARTLGAMAWQINFRKGDIQWGTIIQPGVWVFAYVRAVRTIS